MGHRLIVSGSKMLMRRGLGKSVSLISNFMLIYL